MTSLAEERAEHERWKRLLVSPAPVYDKLLENEFETPERQRVGIALALASMLRFAAREVPYYRDAFRHTNAAGAIDRNPLNVLAALPLLTKLDVQDAGRALRAEHLPPSDQPFNWSQSSGTTGRPTRVLHSKRSATMFRFLSQRGARWHRLEPSAKFAEMRVSSLLPRREDGSEVPPGETITRSAWPTMENFATGPFIGMNVLTPIEQRIAWLRRERPDYLMTYSQTLEFLGLATGDEPPAESLRAVIAISEQLTPSMRRYVERRFGTPVHQVYGLTEIGLVAIRCEAGRYHVHREHCLVEITDAKGRACAPGETGRIVITGLSNFAMPLIRYDTGDLAEAVEGQCPCNRTLPSFGEIVGRYGRAAYCPPGTMGLVFALRETIETMPAAMMRDFREFQIHQFADRRMELRMVVRAPMPELFYERLQETWAKANDYEGPGLSFRSVNEIPGSPGGKSEVFTSDFIPARDGKRPAASAPGTGGFGDD